MRDLLSYKAYIFDLDGTLYRGDKIIEGAAETINKLRGLRKQLLFISNKTTGSKSDYIHFLNKHGCGITPGEMILSSDVLINYLSAYHPFAKVFAIGEKKFSDLLINSGFIFTTKTDEIEIVIVTLDRYINFKKIETAARAIEKGAVFFAANIDNTCPVDSGEIIDAGSVISALEKRTGKKLVRHFGKPSTHMIEFIKGSLECELSETLVTGDRIDTDIAMANVMGADSALVSTGVMNFNHTTFKPTYSLNSVAEIISNINKA
ncbi:MAG: HAD-IIA family hydrolase [Ignavibacteriales bacterium]|nr:HAD-IIA family hydrolase [Ignavibacteriales bacterium]MCF8438205.1 HAD-IIA family hydrolase [Ignavibacteriales bacterium]